MRLPPSWKQAQIHLVSTDEMTGIQALERAAPDQSPQSGQARSIEYEYKRHGTSSMPKGI